jgi:hypothetical protein
MVIFLGRRILVLVVFHKFAGGDRRREFAERSLGVFTDNSGTVVHRRQINTEILGAVTGS